MLLNMATASTNRVCSVSGLNYVSQQAAITGRPSIASLSLGGSASTALDNAVTAVSGPYPTNAYMS